MGGELVWSCWRRCWEAVSVEYIWKMRAGWTGSLEQFLFILLRKESIVVHISIHIVIQAPMPIPFQVLSKKSISNIQQLKQ